MTSSFPHRPLRRPLAIVAILGAIVAGCRGTRVTPAECTEMLDRYIDLTIDQDPAFAQLTPDEANEVRAMKKAVKKAEPRYRKVQEQCEAEVKRREYRCAVAAKNANEWEACID